VVVLLTREVILLTREVILLTREVILLTREVILLTREVILLTYYSLSVATHSGVHLPGKRAEKQNTTIINPQLLTHKFVNEVIFHT
jgi:hypothetical protein